MAPQQTQPGKLTLVWERYRARVLGVLLAVFALPDVLMYKAGTDLTGSWDKAINYAVHNGLVFGTDFAFTYGPLGFLSTRHPQYVGNWVFLLSDLFTAGCFYYLFSRFFARYRGWFFIAVVAIFYLKGSEYASVLFMLFIVFAGLNFKNRFSSYAELVFCAIAGTAVFFIKINYGLISYAILFLLFVWLLLKDRRAFAVLFLTSLAVFCLIYFSVHISLMNYIRYGLPLISAYADGMLVIIDPKDTPFRCAVLLMLVYAMLLGCYLWRARRHGTLGAATLCIAALVSLALFLMYKNGFTRADQSHFILFFLMPPLFFLFVVFLFGMGRSAWAKAACICVIIICDTYLPLPRRGEPAGFIVHAVITPVTTYWNSLFYKNEFTVVPTLPAADLAQIGNATIDIMPIDIAVLIDNGLHYDPRPVIQSYSVYSPVLDSLNAAHFCKAAKPQYAMINYWSIDGRYPMWDESLTKAVLHLNYDYVSFMRHDQDTANTDTLLSNGTAEYLLLKARPIQLYPKFERLTEKTVSLEDTTYIDFPAGDAIYMTADVQYNMPGKIKNLLFQPPALLVSLYFDHSCDSGASFKVIRPSLMEPELINKAVLGNADLRNFLTGNLIANRSIKAFALHAIGRGCKKQVKLTFYKFDNY